MFRVRVRFRALTCVFEMRLNVSEFCAALFNIGGITYMLDFVRKYKHEFSFQLNCAEFFTLLVRVKG